MPVQISKLSDEIVERGLVGKRHADAGGSKSWELVLELMLCITCHRLSYFMCS